MQLADRKYGLGSFRQRQHESLSKNAQRYQRYPEKPIAPRASEAPFAHGIVGGVFSLRGLLDLVFCVVLFGAFILAVLRCVALWGIYYFFFLYF